LGAAGFPFSRKACALFLASKQSWHGEQLSSHLQKIMHC
jgi:hypothetical protein